MRKILWLAALALAATGMASAFDYPPMRVGPRPRRPDARQDQAWLEIANEDRVDYFVSVHPERKQINVSKSGGRGSVHVPSGQAVYIVVPGGGNWQLSGDSGHRLTVPTSRRNTTEITFTPVIKGLKVGTRATVRDGRRESSITMFNHWSRGVIGSLLSGGKNNPPPPPAPAPKPAPQPPKPHPKPQPPAPGRPGPNQPQPGHPNQPNQPPRR